MISEISSKEIQKLFKENVEIGNPNSKGFPQAIFQKLENAEANFYGKYDEISFELTANSVFNSVPYILKGSITYKDDLQTIIHYEVKQMWLPHLMIKFVCLFSLIWGICAVIQNSDLIILAILANLIFLSLGFITNRKNKRKLWKLENDFKILLLITEK